MTTLKGAAIVAQAGGPTSVINASTYGVIKTAMGADAITKVYAAANGIKGVVEGQIYDLSKEDKEELELLLQTPSSAFGSSRYKLKTDEQYAAILATFKKYDICYFFYNGGNDSMDTCNKVSKYLQSVGYDCRVIGVPKTIDNDLALTDHCPGFGSAAKYVATTCKEIYQDFGVYDTPMIVIVEVMGRHAGWLTASSVLASKQGAGPDLIYIPEADFDMDRFLADIDGVLKKQKDCFIVVSEGIHDKDGKFITEYATTVERDGFGHARLGGLAHFLAERVKSHTGIRVRPIEFSLLQRCAAHVASKTDVNEAFNAGRVAVEEALKGTTGKMIAFKCTRDKNGYKCEYVAVDVDNVANLEQKVPTEWITKGKNFITDDFVKYCEPLIAGEVTPVMENGLPRHANLKKILAK